MRLITYKSKKLFYKKFLYKISFNFVLGDIFRSYDQKNRLDYALSKINEYKEQLENISSRSKNKNKAFIEKGYYQKTKFGIEEINDSELLRNSLLELENYMIRYEWKGTLSVYLNDSNVLLNTLQNLKTVDWVEVFEPDLAIVKNTLPDVLVSSQADSFAFKVTLNIGKIRRNNSSMLNWISANRDKIKISDYGLAKAYSYIGVYVRDEKVLMLLQMTGHDYVKRIERLVSPSCSDK